MADKFNPFTGKLDLVNTAAAGTVIGPGSSTNNAIAKWNGTTGTLLSNTGVLIDGSNNITGVSTLTTTGISSTIQANIIAAIREGSIVISSPYVADGFSPALYFRSTTDNPGLPKAAIFSETTSGGSYLFLGTSSAYASGITNLVSISPDSLISSGGMSLYGTRSFVSAVNNAYVYHTDALGLVIYGNGSTDDFTLAGATGANILSVATGTTTARFYGAVNVGGTFTRRSQSGVLSQLQIEGTTFDTSSMSLVVNEASNATTAPSILLGRTRGSTVGSNTVVQDGDRVGIILFGGSDGTNNIANAMIQTVVEGTPATGDVGGRLEFLTTQAGVPGPVIRMSINNVGTATFSGAIAINNTVAAGVAVASTHKVTMVIGGTTYYLLASNV